MSWTAVAIGAGALIGAAGSWFAAQEQGDAAEDAADTRAEAIKEAIEARKEMFKKRMELQKPFREAGYAALPQLQALATGQDQRPAPEMMGPEQREHYASLKEMAHSPLSGVREEINQELANRGMTQSTPGMSNLARGMSRERYNRVGNLYNMAQGVRQNRFNRLSQMANIGQGATAQSSQAAGQFGRGMSNMYGQLGQARARNAMRQGNIRARMWGQMSSMPMRGMQTYLMAKNSGVFGNGNTG